MTVHIVVFRRHLTAADELLRLPRTMCDECFTIQGDAVVHVSAEIAQQYVDTEHPDWHCEYCCAVADNLDDMTIIPAIEKVKI